MVIATTRLVPLLAGIVSAVFAAAAAAQTGAEWHSSAWQLRRIDVDGGNRQPLDTSPEDRCGSPDWSPDGKTIVFCSPRRDRIRDAIDPVTAFETNRD